jgi:hypothetical protein
LYTDDLTSPGDHVQLPVHSNDYARNSAWLQIAALAVSLLAWLRHIGFEGDLTKAEPKMLGYRIFSAPARLVTHARKKILKIPPGWTWSTDLATAQPA